MYKATVTLIAVYKDGESSEKTIEFFIYDVRTAAEANRMAMESVINSSEFSSVSTDFSSLKTDIVLEKLARSTDGVFLVPPTRKPNSEGS